MVAVAKRITRGKDANLHKYDSTFMADIGGARGMTFKSDGSVLALSGITNVANAFAGIGKPGVVLAQGGP
jgi:hypothetical protein